MSQQFEVDSDYLWALEVLVCDRADGMEDPDEDDCKRAWSLVQSEGLDGPMERL